MNPGESSGTAIGRRRIALVIALGAIHIACGPGESGTPDAARSEDAADALDAGLVPRLDAGEPLIGEPRTPALPTPPSSTSQPELGPCPSGWSTQTDDEVEYCEPLPDGLPTSCASHEATFLGEPGCTRVGPSCPQSGWPEDLPVGASLVFVSQTATVSGDGTRGAPFATIQEGTSAASAGDIVVVGPGIYDERLTLRAGVTLWGACTERVVLGGGDGTGIRVAVEGAGAALRRLHVQGGARAVDLVQPGASVDLEDLVIRGAAGFGIRAAGSVEVTGRRVLIDDLRPTTTAGAGLHAEGGARITLDRIAVRGARDHGARVIGAGTTLILEDAIIGATREGSSAYGLRVGRHAHVELRRVVLVDNVGTSIAVSLEDASLVAEDLVVRDTHARADGTEGRGVVVTSSASADLSRVLIERNRDLGLFLWGAGATGTVRDGWIRDTESRVVSGLFGRGIDVENRARLDLERVRVSNNRDRGVFVTGSSSLSARDLSIRGTRSVEVDGDQGGGLLVSGASAASVARLEVLQNRWLGVAVRRAGTWAHFEDVVIVDTVGRALDQEGGRGVEVTAGASLELSRGVVDRNMDFGIFATDATTAVTLEDVVVRTTSASAQYPLNGRGLHVQLGATASVSRGLFDDNQTSGISLVQAAPSELSDLTIRGTRAVDVGAGTVPIGVGLSVAEATARVARASVQANAGVGVQVVGASGALRLEDAVVEETRSPRPGLEAFGLLAAQGAVLEGARVKVDQTRGNGVAGAFADTRIELEDLVVSRTQSLDTPPQVNFSSALVLFGEARATIQRARIEHNDEVGVFVSDGATLQLEDFIIRDTRPSPMFETLGHGVHTSTGTRVVLRRGRVEGSTEVGVIAFSGAVVDMEHVVIHQTLERPCAIEACRDLGAGNGVVAVTGAHVSLRDFLVTDNALCGVQLVRGGEIDLEDGEVSRNAIGANVATEGFDLNRLLSGVVFRDNDRNLDSRVLYVPDAQQAPESLR